MSDITVLMPVYNGASYLGDAIESILAQTEAGFEFIIIDDGSADASVAIADSYSRKDPRIRLVRDGMNRGIAARLNEGLALASGEYIARMDQDDVSLPGRFAAQRSHLDANPDTALVGSRVIVIDPDGDELMEMGDALSHAEIDGGLMRGAGQLVYHPSVMFRRQAALAIGGYDATYRGVEDLDFFLRLAERGRIENLAQPLLKYREHLNKAGATRLLDQEREIDAAIAAARVRRGMTGAQGATERKRRTPVSKAATFRKWGWWALEGGRQRTALKHALRSLAHDPFHHETARLFYCALRDSARPAARAAERKA